jgi:hypothetical protein
MSEGMGGREGVGREREKHGKIVYVVGAVLKTIARMASRQKIEGEGGGGARLKDLTRRVHPQKGFGGRTVTTA